MAAPPLGKYLASNDKSARDKAIRNVRTFLSNSKDVPGKHEMAKLWKGIWYCFWMSDKPLVQQALAQELAELVLAITDTSASLAFLRGFWVTAVREWNAIDHFRLDKFYMLTRRFVNAAFRLLMRADWKQDACEEWNSVLTDQGGPLCQDDASIPAGLTFHLADIYLEELDKVLQPSPFGESPPAVPLLTIISPFLLLVSRTPRKSTSAHLRSNFLIPLLNALGTPSINSPVSCKRPRVEFKSPTFSNILTNTRSAHLSMERKDRLSLRADVLRAVFEVAGGEKTRPANRKLMFAIYRENMEDEDDSL